MVVIVKVCTRCGAIVVKDLIDRHAEDHGATMGECFVDQFGAVNIEMSGPGGLGLERHLSDG